ncbi:MAG: hypothetical protein NXI31_14045 [bacterium]|nr:hypothetical protein [bacterium]
MTTPTRIAVMTTAGLASILFTTSAAAQTTRMVWASGLDASSNMLSPESALGAPDDLEAVPIGHPAVSLVSGFGAGEVTTPSTANLAAFLGLSETALAELDFIVFEFNGSIGDGFETSTWEFHDGSQSVTVQHDFTAPIQPFGPLSNSAFSAFFGYANPNTSGEHIFLGFDLDGTGLDLQSPLLTVRMTASNGAVDNPDVDGMAFLRPDRDSDGLADAAEFRLGTDPTNPDSDGDGLTDGSEIDIADGTGCPDPLVADSDGDSLADGVEVAQGTSPCDPDTDGDSIPDNIDPLPTDPTGTESYLANDLRELSRLIRALPLSTIKACSTRWARARRNAMAHRISAAANLVNRGRFLAATALIASVERRVDGAGRPRDWLEPGPEREALHAIAQSSLALLAYLNH